MKSNRFKWIKWLWRRVITIHPLLRWLFLITFSFLFIYQYLLTIPEMVPFGYEIGKILNRLSFAYVGAFIFFFLNVHIRNYRIKLSIHRYVWNKSVKISNICNKVQMAINNASNNNFQRPLSIEEIECCTKKIDPYTPFRSPISNVDVVSQHWFDFFRFVRNESKEHIDSLLGLTEFLDEEFLEILTNLDDCLENHIDYSRGEKIRVQNDTLEFFSIALNQYIQNIEELNEYRNKNLNLIGEEYRYKQRKKRKKAS